MFVLLEQVGLATIEPKRRVNGVNNMPSICNAETPSDESTPDREVI